MHARVGDDADDRAPGRIGPVVLEPPAERIEVGPVLPRHRLVDDADGRAGGRVAAVEEPSGLQREAHRLHVAGAHRPVVRVVMERPIDRHALGNEPGGAAFPHERQGAADARRRDAGQLANALEHGVDELSPLRRIGVRPTGQAGPHRQHLRGLEAERHGADRAKALHEQARGNQHRRRQRDLGDDERASKPRARAEDAPTRPRAPTSLSRRARPATPVRCRRAGRSAPRGQS